MRDLPPLVPAHSRLPASEDRPQGHLANFFVPVGHVRYDSLVAWSATAKPALWRMGKSTDGRDGIWIGRGIWEDFAIKVSGARRPEETDPTPQRQEAAVNE
jgi:hypothetical protein